MAGVVILAMGLGLVMGPPGANAADTGPPLVTTLQNVVDGVGDVVNGVTAGLFDNGRADITAASVEWAPGWIRMKTQLKTLTDPLKDPAWSDSDDIEWDFDTNNDGKPDYTVEFATDKGQLYGAVFDTSKPGNESVCDADSASFSAQDGYTMVIDPKCLGNPKSLYWAVTTFISANPKDANAQVVSDRVPDLGFKPQSAPGEPAPAPAFVPPPPPAGPPGPPPGAAPGPGGTRAPASVTPNIATPKPKAAGAPAAPGRTAAGASSSTTAAPAPAAGAPAPAGTGGGQAAVAAPPGNLARTGSTSSRDGLFGLGLMLLGFGVVVMTRPTRRVGVPA